MNTQTKELRDWLAVTSIPQLGPITILKLLELFHTPTTLLQTSKSNLYQAGVDEQIITVLQQPNWSAVDRCLAWMETGGVHVIHYQMPNYPPLLREIAAPPLVLFIRGDLERLSQPQLAIVGTRQPSPTGLEIAQMLACGLGQVGLTITSGLALGIDSASHQAALAAQAKTIAVLGTGPDRCYPKRNHDLAERIVAQGGALVSEFWPGTLPKARHFPQRNRLISGLSLGVLVVEATLASGSLITARYALDQGREVFAVPGSIYNPLAKGCHALLRQGAKLVEGVEDILEELPIGNIDIRQIRTAGTPDIDCAAHGLSEYRKKGKYETGNHLAVNPVNATYRPTAQATSQSGKMLAPLAPKDQKLLECLGFEATAVDTIIARSGLGADNVTARLMLLELQGYIYAVPGGYMKA